MQCGRSLPVASPPKTDVNRPSLTAHMIPSQSALTAPALLNTNLGFLREPFLYTISNARFFYREGRYGGTGNYP